MNAANLFSWLPFDESTTEDLCGNEWTAYGDVSLSSEITKFGTASIHLPSGAYLSANNILDLNADKWTFNCWCLRVSSSGAEGFFGLGEGSSRRGIIVSHDGVYIATSGGGSWQQKNSSLRLPSELNQWKHLEIDKDDTSLKFFENGSLVWSTTINGLNDTGVFLIGGNSYGYTSDLYFAEVMFYEGVALHTENFTPPTNDDYLQLRLDMGLPAPFEFDADIARQVVNALGQEKTIHFDGSCYGLLPLGVLAGATTFTIEAKFSTTSTKSNSSNYNWATILGRNIAGSWQNEFGLCVNGGKLCFWAEPKTGGSSSTSNTISQVVVNDGAIHDVAVVSSEGAINLYCDGVLVAHTAAVNAKIPDAYSFGVAYNLRESPSYLRMDLYEARLWSVARAQEQIFAPLQGDEQGLEAYYLPEVRTDNILPDLSGNENHATLYGSAHVFPFDFVFDADTVVKIYKDKIQEQLTIWLPFNNYPTEDLCGNWWISTNPNIIIRQLSGEEADDNHTVALYLTSPTDSAQGQLVLNCQGMYLGGKDFTVSFDWWYGGAPPFSANCPFGLWDENYSAEGSIYIYNRERFNADWDLTSLRAFGQSTPEFDIDYHSWHSIEVRYLHPEGRLVFFCDGSGLATLGVTIPRTFFPHVEIDRAAPAEHGTGFISNFKISGGEVAPDCPNKPILLCIRHNGGVIQLPFRAYEFVDHLALAVRYDGRNWYNVLRDPADEHASDFYIKHAESTYALTKG